MGHPDDGSGARDLPAKLTMSLGTPVYESACIDVNVRGTSTAAPTCTPAADQAQRTAVSSAQSFCEQFYSMGGSALLAVTGVKNEDLITLESKLQACW
jgi:hypothetical protein